MVIKKKDLIIYPAFPVGIVFQGNQTAPANEEKELSFTAEYQLINIEK